MKNTRTLRADIPVAAWEALADQAREAGLPLGRHARNILVAASGVARAEPIPLTPSNEQWAALKLWAAEHPEVFAHYDGQPGRSWKMAHAVKHGFPETP